MTRMYSGLLAVPILWAAIALGPRVPAVAQRSPQTIHQLYAELRGAVCQNDWSEALQIIDPMIRSTQITAAYRNELVQFRQRLRGWQATSAHFTDSSMCDRPSEQAQSAPDPDRTSSPSQVADRSPRGADSDPSRQDALLDSARRSPSSRPVGEAARDTPGETGDRLVQAQCQQLGNIVNRADAQAQMQSDDTDLSDFQALLRRLSDLAFISDQARLNLQTMSLSDSRLRDYQENLIEVYTAFGQATRGFVSAAGEGNQQAMQISHQQIQSMASQETALIAQVNTYCGGTVIVNN